MAENKGKVTFIFCDGSKKQLPIREAVLAEVTCKGTIEGGRPPFEEVAVKETKSKKKVEEGDK